MHFVSFAFKRAHYTTLAMGQRLAQKFGLTSARFDLLRCVRVLGKADAFQANIARALGVSEVTVGRMARALEAKGLVRRPRSPRDARTRLIRLTKEGRRRYFLVLRRLQRKPLQRPLVTLTSELLRKDQGDAILFLSSSASFLHDALVRLGDHSTFRYPDWDFVDPDWLCKGWYDD